MAPNVGTNGNNVQVAGLVDNQVNVNDIQTRANAGRLTIKLRSLKGLLTREINFCKQKITHFRTLMASTQQRTFLMTEYARSVLECHARCKTKWVEVDKGFADLKALKIETWDKKDDEGLEQFLTLLNTDYDACYQKVTEVQDSNMEIFEKCWTLTALTTPHTMREIQGTAPNITYHKLLFLDVHNVLGQSNQT